MCLCAQLDLFEQALERQMVDCFEACRGVLLDLLVNIDAFALEFIVDDPTHLVAVFQLLGSQDIRPHFLSLLLLVSKEGGHAINLIKEVHNVYNLQLTEVSVASCVVFEPAVERLRVVGVEEDLQHYETICELLLCKLRSVCSILLEELLEDLVDALRKLASLLDVNFLNDLNERVIVHFDLHDLVLATFLIFLRLSSG